MIPTNANFDAAQAALAKKPIHLLTIAGYSRVFTSPETGVGGQYPWIAEMGSLQQAAQDRDGGSSLSDLEITVIDKSNLITADFPGFTFEGKQATIKTGFSGMLQADYITVATMRVDSVASSKDNTAYVFRLTDNSLKFSQMVYRTGDDGRPTATSHPKTVSGNPMDVLLDVLQNQLGLSAGEINTTAINNYKNSIFAGMKMKWSLTRASEAKQWLELEIFKALGGYGFQNYAGAYTPFFFIPRAAPTIALTLNDHNIEGVPEPSQADLVNFLSYRFDYDGSKFQTELSEVFASSANTYGLQEQQIIEARGARAVYGSWIWARLLANALFLRYGSKAPMVKVKAFWNAVILEPGDFVYLTHPLVPNRAAGTMGITNRLFEVLEVEKDFQTGAVNLTLLDVNWLAAASMYQVAPDGTPVWTLATPAQKAQYMFVASASTGNYSDGAAGHKIP